jgi:hypothetical protein
MAGAARLFRRPAYTGESMSRHVQKEQTGVFESVDIGFESAHPSTGFERPEVSLCSVRPSMYDDDQAWLMDDTQVL